MDRAVGVLVVSMVTTGDVVEACIEETFSDLDFLMSLASWRRKHIFDVTLSLAFTGKVYMRKRINLN